MSDSASNSDPAKETATSGPYAASDLVAEPNDGSQKTSSSSGWATKVIVLALVGATFYFITNRYGDQLTIQSLANRESDLQGYESQHPWAVIGGAFLLYVAVSGLSIPGGAVALSLVYGSYFGWLRAVAIVSFASTAGATVAFLTSRYLFRDFVQQKFATQLVKFNRRLEEEGAFYLFSLRLIFAVPFFALNLLMGLTKMPWTTYWWVSQIGMLPGTMAYVYAGSTVKLQQLAQHGFGGVGWQTLLAFCILGLLPITIKKLMNVWSNGSN